MLLSSALRRSASLVWIVAFVFLLGCPGAPCAQVPAAEDDGTDHASDDGAAVPVLVELFTSQGCSSCPPADRLLRRLAEEQPVAGAEIIVLSEHVNYWDRLGWRDPFSSEELTERQRVYARVADEPTIYTPQMVVDGRYLFVGSREEQAHLAIMEATEDPKARVELEACANDEPCIEIRAGELPPSHEGPVEVLLAVARRHVETDVGRGENSGRHLEHTSVVRRLEVLGAVGDDGVFRETVRPRLDAAWKASDLVAVVFLQERASRRILGAAAVDL